MKWIYLLAILIGTPVLTLILRAKQRYLIQACFWLGFSLFALAPNLWIAPVGWAGWPGPIQGVELSFIDGISVALILSTGPVRVPWSIKGAFGIICIAILLSSLGAHQLEPIAFYVTQLIRSVLLFYAVARVCFMSPRAAVALVCGLGAGLIYEAALAGYEFTHGAFRPGGNLGHSNFLGLSTDFVVAPAFAIMLGTRRLWPALVVIAAFVIAVVGASRATLVLFGVGVLLTIALALWQSMSARKAAFAAAAALLLLVSAPVMLWGVSQRSHEAIESSDQERAAMKEAALMMITEHPFGVGADQYVVIANVAGYSQRAGVTWDADTRTAPVHDTYYLITAELGFIGLAGFLCLLAAALIEGIKILRRRVKDDAMCIVPGLLTAMILVMVHISYEFVFMNFIPHYLFAIIVGLIVAISARSSKVTSSRRVPSVQRDVVLQAS